MEAAYKVIKDMAPYFPKQLQALSNVTAAHSTIKSLTEVPQATQDYTELANIVKNAVTVRSLDTQALMFLEPELSKGAERYQKAACDNLRSVLNSVQDEAAQVSKKLEKYRSTTERRLLPPRQVVDKEVSHLQKTATAARSDVPQDRGRDLALNGFETTHGRRERRTSGSLPRISVRDLNAKGWPSLNPMPLRSTSSALRPSPPPPSSSSASATPASALLRCMSEPMLKTQGEAKPLPTIATAARPRGLRQAWKEKLESTEGQASVQRQAVAGLSQ
eukprot:g30938.t1